MHEDQLLNPSDTEGTVPATIKGVIVFKIDVTCVPHNEIIEYMSNVSVKMADERFKRQGWVYYFLPIRNSETTITFIDLETMKSVIV